MKNNTQKILPKFVQFTSRQKCICMVYYSHKVKKEVIQMKFYSVSNPDHHYTYALSLTDVRALEISEFTSTRSASRFGVRIEYLDGAVKQFPDLTEDRAHMIYKDILEILNKEG